MVAGSSGMQGMMYTRPHRTVLDEWGRLNPGWSYDEALPYFIKSENNLNPELVEPEYHGFSGPLTVQHFPSRPVLADAVVEAAGQMGYRNGDLNGRNQTGAAVAQMMVHEGLRASTARMYLRPYVHERDNLKVGINSHVTKVLLNPTTKVAFGVQYLNKDGRIRYAFARKEVILSAGSINSPQLLLLSGVGPSKHLREVGIDVIVHLPGVGHNLHNHVSGSIGYTMDEPGTNFLTRDAVREFIDKRTGPLSSTGLTQTTILMTSKYSRQGVSDLQVFFNGYNTLCSMTGNPAECEAAGGFGNCSRRTLLARPTLTLPLSRGYLKLRSSNPLDYPLIYPNYFAVQHDVEVLVEGIKLSIELANTPALQKYGLVVNETKESGCQQHTFGTDEYFACAVKWNTGPDNHQSGSCKMGPATDAMAVVDNELRVHGVRNLRVVDASIFPRVPNSNPTATIVMAAEKLSDMVKSSWRRGCY